MNQNAAYFGQPADPATHDCEFCDEPATEAFTLRAHRLYVYACNAHHAQARRAVDRSVKRGGANLSPNPNASSTQDRLV